MGDADTTVHTLSDLAAWSRPGTHLAVLGHPVAHSLSPPMHNAALAKMSARDPRFRDWRYHRFDIAPGDLPRALKLFHEKKFRGLNLTVPHKVIALDCDGVASIDPAARPVGAVNTLSWTPRGWAARNTDGHGLAAAIRETLALDLAGAHILLLGAGGAARGAAVECLRRRCASLTLANRTPANLDALLAHLRPLAGDIPLAVLGSGPPFTTHYPPLIINATSSGLKPADPAPLDLEKLPVPPAGVFDMIYNPPETPLLAQARALGFHHANGLAMLVHQGARALEVWTAESGARVPLDAMRRALPPFANRNP